MHIQVSKATRNRLLQYPEYRIQPRGNIKVKGKGDLYTYWLVGKAGVYDFSKYVTDEEVDKGGGGSAEVHDKE